MAERVQNVLLLASRLGCHDHGWPVLSFLDRLARRGVSAQVLCHSSAGDAVALAISEGETPEASRLRTQRIASMAS